MKSPDSFDDRKILLLAIAIERCCAQLYQDCAYRFRPYNPGISTVLEELAKEERQHEQELTVLFTEVIAEDAALELPAPPQLQAYTQGLRQVSDHFFVVNPPMARTILEMALEIERYTHGFYLDIQDKLDDPRVSALICKLVAFEDDHVRVFLERLERI